MELHSSPTVGKKLWNVLRIAFFMMRKGLVSKRKLIMDMNLMMQRGKLLGMSLGKNLTFHPNPSTTTSFGLHEYEFSCTNSPNPNFFRAYTKARKHSYFPCMGGSSAVEEQPDRAPGPVVGLPRPVECTPKSSSGALAGTSDLAPCTPIRSPFSVRVSNYSLAEEEGDRVRGGEVDNQAEEFIKRFYQQLNAQGQIALLQYQEQQYQEMLARGT